jgi:poly-gamma-glutamate capsule biosynthesis protein CapA/YwtB (metallophosphatase superfamily)
MQTPFNTFRLVAVIVAATICSGNLSGQSARDTLTVIGTGDIMLGTNFPSAEYLPPDSARGLLKPVIGILKDADLTFGNLEGVFLNEGGAAKKCQDMSKCYAFRMPGRFVFRLQEAGFDVVSLANNHSGDFGDTGRITTMAMLEKAGIHYAGLLSCPVAVFEKNGITWGFVAFSPFRGTVPMLNEDSAVRMVKTLDSLCDIVMVSVHAGAEGAKYKNVTRQTEIFYEEDRGNIYAFAHKMIDAGADIIFGHGPHITRAVEHYNGRFIAYSLGNFCTYGRFNLKGSNGVAPIIKVFVAPDGTFLQAQVYSILQAGKGGPEPDPENRALQELRMLTKEDFPETRLKFFDNGLILPD